MSRVRLVDNDRASARMLQLRSLEETVHSHVECVLQATARHHRPACQILLFLQPCGT